VTVAAGTPVLDGSAADAVEMSEPDAAPDDLDRFADTAADTAAASVDGASGVDSASSQAPTGDPEPDAPAGATDVVGATEPDPA